MQSLEDALGGFEDMQRVVAVLWISPNDVVGHQLPALDGRRLAGSHQAVVELNELKAAGGLDAEEQRSPHTRSRGNRREHFRCQRANTGPVVGFLQSLILITVGVKNLNRSEYPEQRNHDVTG